MVVGSGGWLEGNEVIRGGGGLYRGFREEANGEGGGEGQDRGRESLKRVWVDGWMVGGSGRRLLVVRFGRGIGR